MSSLTDYFPWYAWVGMFACALLAVVPFFVSPSVAATAGVSRFGYIALVAGAEFVAAVGIASLVVYYRPTNRDDEDDSEWRFDP